MRRPPSSPRWWEAITPGQAFGWFVTWCALGIVATALMILLYPWSIPIWLGAILAIGYFASRALKNMIRARLSQATHG
jgi:hypothetical protein